MPLLIPDTIQDSLSFYLRAEEQPVLKDPFYLNFGSYEYLPTNPQGVLFAPDSATFEMFSPTFGNEGLMFSFSPIVSGTLFLMFLLCFVLFSVIFSKEGVALSGNFSNIFSLGKRSSKGFKEQVTTTEIWGEFFMIFQAILLYTIFSVTFLQEKVLLSFSLGSYISSFLGVFLVIAILLGLKYLIYKMIASFFLRNDINNWISRYFRLIELSGAVLFIPLFTYVFLPESRDILIIIIVIIFVSVRLIVIVELLNIFVKNKVGSFYFFVYLCGTEIAPYLLYYKGLQFIISILGNNIV